MVDNVRIVAGQLDRFAGNVIKALVLEATSNLIEATPVDTGWARANWVPSIGAPKFGPETPTDKGRRRSATTSQKGTQQTGLSSVATGYTLSRGVVSIANGVPYISVLNGGSSRKAPAAFVQGAILKAVRTVSLRKFV
jgi:hypothetical protein